MSHFSVLVIGDQPEEQLEPFQENNCGDCPKHLLEFYDIEPKYLEKYQNETVEMVKTPEGELLLEWNERFRVPGALGTGGFGGSNPTHKVPDYCEIVEVQFTELYETFDDYMSDWCGHSKRDPEKGKYGYWENPNAKWDWYQLGGRWTGYFKLKENAEGKVGDYSLVSKKRASDGYADQAYKKDIDFESMRDEAGAKAAKYYDAVAKLYGDIMPTLKYHWVDLMDSREYKHLSLDEKRDIYNEQPAIKLQRSLMDKRDQYSEEAKDFIVWGRLDDLDCSREEYINRARYSAISTFAVIKDGKWYEKGEMGWWGLVKDRKEQTRWDKEFSKLLDQVPDNTLLSLYDCHI